jgi:hypothetical protein
VVVLKSLEPREREHAPQSTHRHTAAAAAAHEHLHTGQWNAAMSASVQRSVIRELRR